jgi:sugar phosphate isomerase/epimerase
VQQDGTMRLLGLHQVTVIDLDPLAFLRVAAESGCDSVSVFTHVPELTLPGQRAQLRFPIVTPDIKGSFLERLADTDLAVAGAEFFPLTAEVGLADYAPALALAREIGASRAVTHIHDLETGRVVERLGRLCEMAGAEGLSLAIEFSPMTRGCDSLQRAAWFVDQVGRSSLSVGVDCLHLIRSGGTVEDLGKLDDRYFGYAQICDGHGLHRSADYMVEARDRGLPGAGDFPLAAIIAALPKTLPLEVEVPSAERRAASVSALDHARDVVARTRALVEGAAAQ